MTIRATPEPFRPRRGPALVVCAVCAAWLLPGCAPAPETSPSPRRPARVVSLAPNLTATVQALGDGARLVGVSRFCRAPEGTARVGGYLDPDVETIVSLKPDLVITPPNPHFEKAMAAFDIPVRIMQAQWSTLSNIVGSIRQVGEVLGRAPDGRALAARVEAELDEVRRRAAAREVASVLWIIERQPGSLVVVGPDNHLDELLTLAGGRNVVREGGPYPVLDIENVVRLAPEVILDVSAQARTIAADTQAMQAVWADYQTVPAVQHHRLLVADPSDLVQPGPGVGLSASVLFQLLHGAP